jgi:hypothetical protein
MKSKVARKQVRHAVPARKHARVKKQVRVTPAPAKKEATEPVASEPQIIETTVVAFEEPVEFFVTEPEPAADVVEVFELAVDENDV